MKIDIENWMAEQKISRAREFALAWELAWRDYADACEWESEDTWEEFLHSRLAWDLEMEYADIPLHLKFCA
jgi:hypothetical protein